jgi:signal transduction histidine kinase
MADSRRYAELAELAGSFIHEIKNHLSTLGLNLQLLAEDFQEPQNQRERRALERIQRLQGECQRLVDVSNDFLRFARLKELEFQPSALNDVVEELVDFFGPSARQAGIEIKCYLPADLPRVPLDRELFKQALLNLLLNAQQAMPDGGEVTLQAGVEKFNADDGVCISVIDTGKGMSPDVIAKAFKPFFRRVRAGQAWACRPRVKSSRPTAAASNWKALSDAERSSRFICQPLFSDRVWCLVFGVWFPAKKHQTPNTIAK